MVSANLKMISTLNNLVAVCKDAEYGYLSAGEDVGSGELKELFNTYVSQRAQFANELLNEIHRLDVAHDHKGTVLAMIHRGWMNMKAALTRRDASAIVQECARGEQAARKDYEAALKLDLPPEIRTLVERQYEQLRVAQQRLETLKPLAVLHHLIATCKDGVEGFRTAREHVGDPKLRELFDSCSQQRAQFVTELQAEARRLGDTGEKKGTLAAYAHRGWMTMKSAIKGDGAAILTECKRAERIAVKHYEEALGQELPAEIRTLVARQSAKVKEMYDRLGTLQEEMHMAVAGSK